MSQLTRTLTFVTNDLGKDTTFFLTFDDANNPGRHKSVIHRTWKVSKFGQSGQYAFKVRYQSELAFIASVGPSIDPRDMFFTHIKAGEKTFIEKPTNLPRFKLSTPSLIQPPTRCLVAKNATDQELIISLGLFEKSDRPPLPILLFEHISPDASVQIDFTPLLLGQIMMYREDGEILGSQVVFEENLDLLEKETYWELKYDRATDAYKITRQW